MSDGKADATDTAALTSSTSSPAPKPSLVSRVGAHFKKWWWVHGIILIVVVLVVVLPVVYVDYPKLAQSDVTKSTLNITSMSISAPTPDSFHLTQTQVIGSKSSFHPTIYAFSAAVSLLGASAPWGTVQVPQVKAEDGAVVEIDETVQLSDERAFAEFAKTVMMSEKFGLSVNGKAGLRLGALPKVGVDYYKSVNMKGLNKLSGFDITEFELLGKDEPDGTNTRGTVYIPNPTVMTITMGNITLDLSANGTHIGQSFLNDLTLYPGNNTIPMKSTIDTMAVIKALPADSVLPVDIRGNSSVYEGKELEYFSEALAANVLDTRLDVGKAFMGGL